MKTGLYANIHAKRKRIASSRSVARTVRKKPHLSATPGSEHEHEHEHEKRY